MVQLTCPSSTGHMLQGAQRLVTSTTSHSHQSSLWTHIHLYQVSAANCILPDLFAFSPPPAPRTGELKKKKNSQCCTFLPPKLVNAVSLIDAAAGILMQVGSKCCLYLCAYERQWKEISTYKHYREVLRSSVSHTLELTFSTCTFKRFFLYVLKTVK